MPYTPLHQKKPSHTAYHQQHPQQQYITINNANNNNNNNSIMEEHPSVILTANYQFNETDKSMTVADFLRKQVELKNNEMKLLSERMVEQLMVHGAKHREEIKQAFKNQQKQ